MNERDSFFGYGGFYPFSNQMSEMISPNYIGENGFNTNYLNDFNKRIERLERQINRLDQRITRLETPYAFHNSNNEPDNSMYMM